MKLRKNESGFSIVEVLSSMTVFAIAATGFVSTTMTTIKSNSASRETTVASALIQDKIEELRALDPRLNPADFAEGSHYDAENPLIAIGDTDGVYTRTWEVNVDEPEFGLSEVVVSVSWTGANGRRSLRASTLICNTATCS